MSSLARTALYALTFGIFLGAVYDLVRILRIIAGVSDYGVDIRFSGTYSGKIKNLFSGNRSRIFSSVFVAVTDFAFFMFAGISFILFLYCFNFGIFRWFILLSAILGFRLYYISIGRAVISLSGNIASVILFIINTLIYIAMIPARKAAKLLSAIFSAVVENTFARLKRSIDKKHGKCYTHKCIKELDKFIEKV